jgi:hypothetical protein
LIVKTHYDVMRYGPAYLPPMEAADAAQVRPRLQKQLQPRAKELDHELKKIEAPAAAEGTPE